MKAIYFDCSMGAAGDMLCAALLDTLDNPGAFVDEFNALGLSGVIMALERSEKCGVQGRHVRVFINGREEGGHSHDHVHEHHHRGLSEIAEIISALGLPQQVLDDAASVYGAIAKAEAHVHGKPIGEVHFHEVGALDAIADVVAFSMLIHLIAPDKIYASPVHVGSGTVTCAHGILPVPAPATAELLKGIPTYGGEIRGELCTPTGAALLRHFADSFGAQPLMTVSSVGYGMGTKDFPAANCVRAMIGEQKPADD